MRHLVSMIIAVMLLCTVCVMPIAAEREDAGEYYEFSAEKSLEILAGEAGHTDVRWTVPYFPIAPTINGVINPNEYAQFEGFEDYITLAVTKSYGADKANALYEQVKNGIFDAYWCWDGRYFYLAFDVDCVDGYNCTPEQPVLLFAYNCLQVGLADVDAVGKDDSYTELGFGYDAERGENITQTWYGAYWSESDDFAGKYDQATNRVTYELRIDLQQALGLEIGPGIDYQCSFAFSLEIAGDNSYANNAQVMFCHGMAGQYADKHTEYFAGITFEGYPNVVISPGTPIVLPEYEAEYELQEWINFSEAAVFSTMVGEGVNLTQVTEGEDTFMRITAAKDGGYVYSTVYPMNLRSDIKYLVIKYRTDSQKGRKCGVIWKTRQNPEYDVKNCYTTYIENDGEWNYLLLDMSDEPKWADYIRYLGIAPFYGMENVAGEVMDIAWIKAYAVNPYDLYAESEPGHEPETSPIESWDTGIAPDTTEPYYEETVWETFYEQDVPEETDRELGGLFFEVFGDDALSGCKGQPMGCKNGNCNAVAGGFWVICLLAAGLVFRKKE